MNTGVLNECMKYFKDTLKSFIIEQFKTTFGESWIEKALNPPGKDTHMTLKKNPDEWDLSILVNMIHDHWDQIFFKIISDKFPKSMFTVVKFYRNSWAHQSELTDRDIYRIIDLMQNILEGLSLSYALLENKRRELLISLATPLISPQRGQIACNGCNIMFNRKQVHECDQCGLIGCSKCLCHYFVEQNTAKCPRCLTFLSPMETDVIVIQKKHLFPNS